MVHVRTCCENVKRAKLRRIDRGDVAYHYVPRHRAGVFRSIWLVPGCPLSLICLACMWVYLGCKHAQPYTGNSTHRRAPKAFQKLRTQN